MKPSKSMEHVGLVAWKLPCKGVAAIVASVCLLWKNIDISRCKVWIKLLFC